VPFISRPGEDLQEKMAWVCLDSAECDVMSHLARDYPAPQEGGGRGTAAQRLLREGLRNEFHKTAVSINPSFARYTAEDLWKTAAGFNKTIRGRQNAADGLGGRDGHCPVTPISSRGAKDLLEHVEVYFEGLFHPANGGNVGKDLEPHEKCFSLWKSLQGVVRISGVLIQTWPEFYKFWEESSPACLSVTIDLQAANKLEIQPLAYSVESVGQNKGFEIPGLDMFQTKQGGGCRDVAKQDVIHFAIVNVPRLLEAGFTVDKPVIVKGHQVAELQRKLHHLLHEARYFSEAGRTNRSEAPIELSLRGNPEGLFPQHLCLAKFTLFRNGIVDSVWTKPRTAVARSFCGGYGNAAAGTNLELQIDIANSRLQLSAAKLLAIHKSAPAGSASAASNGKQLAGSGSAAHAQGTTETDTGKPHLNAFQLSAAKLLAIHKSAPAGSASAASNGKQLAGSGSAAHAQGTTETDTGKPHLNAFQLSARLLMPSRTRCRLCLLIQEDQASGPASSQAGSSWHPGLLQLRSALPL
jgi:hypothetical protein